MRFLILLLFFKLFISLGAIGQENPAPYFICLYNGTIQLPFLNGKQENRHHVKSAMLLHPYTVTENESLRYDTTRIYQKWYTPRGEEITLENNPYSEFKGFSKLSFNKDGTLASKKFETRGIRGCGNYHWSVGGVVEYNYKYEKDRCTKIYRGDSSYVVNTYNKKGLKTITTGYYYSNITDSVSKVLSTDEYSYQYRYDNQSRLTEEYKIYNYISATEAVHIPDLPSNILQILLRQTPEYKNKYLIDEFGITEDSLYVYEAELPEDYVKRINERDSIDYEIIEQYKKMTRYFTGYEYNEKDQLIRRYILEGDELQQVDTFSYDDKGRLVTWEQLEDFYLWNNWDKGKRTIWTFQYLSNQLIHCDHQEYGREYQSDFSSRKEKPVLTLKEAEIYDFTYDARGAVLEMKKQFQNSYRDDFDRYFVRYEYH